MLKELRQESKTMSQSLEVRFMLDEDDQVREGVTVNEAGWKGMRSCLVRG